MSLNFDPNILYYKMALYFSEHKNDEDKVIICNEGGTRSSKTWDFYHFLVTYCDHNRNKGKDIYILRESLVNCKDFTLKEFENCLNHIGIPCNPITSPKPYFNLYGNNIYFRGLDSEVNTEGFPSDITFVNEGLETENSQIIGILMRCKELFVMDWNPKFTDHWAFELKERPNCLFTHSTYKDNKHLSKAVVNEIEGYSPWLLEDMLLPEDERRPHEKNIKNRTADKYRWEVYGLGLRAAREGLIFPQVEWIDKFPEDIDNEFWGMDFGYTNDPTAITKMGLKGELDLYVELKYYAPTENIQALAPILEMLLDEDSRCWADSADPGMIADCRRLGYTVYGASKFKGSINYGIDLLKRYRLHIVDDRSMRKEQENYSWKEINGIRLNIPIDKFNHAWDSMRYGAQMELRV